MIKKIKRFWSLIREIRLDDSSSEITKCDVLLFCHDVDRGISFQNQAYSPLLDSIQEDLNKQGLSTLTVAHPWSKLTGEKAFGTVVSINRSYLLASVKSKILKRDYRTPFFKKILRKASPKKIITIGCGDNLCKAARELKIHHAELLHGIGYDPIPWSWDTKNAESLPQEVLTLDSVSTKTFKPLEKHGVKVTQIEHPFLKRFTVASSSKLPEEWKLVVNQKFKKEILVSLQWGYTEGVDCHEEFEGVLPNGLLPEELISVIQKTKDDIFWRIRFHPVQLRNEKKYKKHFKLIDDILNKYGNGEWEEASSKPLPVVLGRCSGHVTMSSMSSYEAAYMGIKTLSLCPSLLESGVYENVFNDLVEKMYLTKMKIDERSIFNWVNNVQVMKPLLEF